MMPFVNANYGGVPEGLWADTQTAQDESPVQLHGLILAVHFLFDCNEGEGSWKRHKKGFLFVHFNSCPIQLAPPPPICQC